MGKLPKEFNTNSKSFHRNADGSWGTDEHDGKIKEVVDYDVENDGEDWCVNCIAQIHADSIDNAKEAMEQLFANVPFNWDYHYIKGLDTQDYYEP